MMAAAVFCQKPKQQAVWSAVNNTPASQSPTAGTCQQSLPAGTPVGSAHLEDPAPRVYDASHWYDASHSPTLGNCGLSVPHRSPLLVLPAHALNAPPVLGNSLVSVQCLWQSAHGWRPQASPCFAPAAHCEETNPSVGTHLIGRALLLELTTSKQLTTSSPPHRQARRSASTAFAAS